MEILMRRFELIEGKSSKFWEVEAAGTQLTVRFGRIGTNGQAQTKDCGDAAAAQVELTKLVKQKTAKGYSEIGSHGTPSPAAVKATPIHPAKVVKPVAAKVPGTTPSATLSAGAPSAASAVATGAKPVAFPNSLPWPSDGFRPELLRDWKYEVPVLRGVHVPPFHDPDMTAEQRKKTALADLAKFQKTAARASGGLNWRAFHHGDADTWRHVIGLLAYGENLGEGQSDKGIERIIRAGITLHGLEFMLHAFLQTHSDRYKVDQRITSWDYALRILRHAIADSDAQTHAQLCDIASKYRNEEMKLVCLYLFAHHREWIDDALVNPQDDFDQWVDCCPLTIEEAIRITNSDNANHEGLSLLHKLHGRDVMRLLDSLFIKPAKYMEGPMEWVLAMQYPEQIGLLVRHFDQWKLMREALPKLANQYPAATLYTAILEVLANHSLKLQSWTLQLARKHPQALEQALSVLPPQQCEAWNTLSKGEAANETRPSALPPVLAAPPWTLNRVAVKLSTLGGKPLDVTPQITWTDAERLGLQRVRLDSWEVGMFASAAERAGSPELAVLNDFGFEVKDAKAIVKGQTINLSGPQGQRNIPTKNITLLLQLPSAFALRLWNEIPSRYWYLGYHGRNAPRVLLAQHGIPALPAFESFCTHFPNEGLPLALGVQSAPIARLMVHALSHLKKCKLAAQRWITEFPEATAKVALHAAFGGDATASAAAAFALRWMLSQGKAALIDEVALAYRGEMSAAWNALKALDPLIESLPARLPKMPAFYAAVNYARPRLKEGSVLPLTAVDTLATMLAFSPLDVPYPGIEQVREACDAHSLAEFAWDLYTSWHDYNGPSKEIWAFTALGLLGTDDTVRRLAPKLRNWPSEGLFTRAVTGLDVLAAIGTDLALTHLNAIAEKVKSKALQSRAKDKIAAIAEARDLSPEQLADRLVPTLGLDEAGALTLDFGARQFGIAFDEALKPYVKDDQGQRLKDLPKPRASDDAGKSEAAAERFKLLKKDAKSVAAMQVARMERAMTLRKTWSAEEFSVLILSHPLLRFVAARLVWGVFGEAYAFVEGFRVAEDYSLADANDAPYILPAQVRVGVVHVLDTPEHAKKAFARLFADYEIQQPFSQLGREVYAFTPDELAKNAVVRFANKKVRIGSVMGLVDKGWAREPVESGSVNFYFKPVSESTELVMMLDPGWVVDDHRNGALQSVTEVTLRHVGSAAYGDRLPLREIDALAASEALRDLDLLAAEKE